MILRVLRTDLFTMTFAQGLLYKLSKSDGWPGCCARKILAAGQDFRGRRVNYRGKLKPVVIK